MLREKEGAVNKYCGRMRQGNEVLYEFRAYPGAGTDIEYYDIGVKATCYLQRRMRVACASHDRNARNVP